MHSGARHGGSRSMRHRMGVWLLVRHREHPTANALVLSVAAAGLQARLPRPHEPDATEWQSRVVRDFLSLPDRCGGRTGGCGRVGDTDSLPPLLKHACSGLQHTKHLPAMPHGRRL